MPFTMKYTQASKKCIRCGNMRSDYTKNRKSCDRCLEQTSEYQKQRLEKTKEHRTVRAREYRKTAKGKLIASTTQTKQYAKFPKKIIARVLVHRAKKNGKIKELPCKVCRNLKVEAHHADYSKPLEVVWFCKSHHVEAHRLAEFVLEEECLQYIFHAQYGKKSACPKCGNKDRFYLIESRKRFDCTCGYSISPLAGTIFYKSSTLITKWFEAIYFLSLEDVSAKELQRRLGVTYKTAWRMKEQISLLGKGSFREMIARAVMPVSRDYGTEIL